MISFQTVPVITGMDDREGRLVLVGGCLAAVIVRLDDPEHGPLVGKWFVEWMAVHDHPDGALFDSPEDAAALIKGRLGGC